MFVILCCRRMEKISWTDRVRNEEMLHRDRVERNIIHTVKRGKANWIGYSWRGKSLLTHVIEGKIEGRIEGMRIKGRRRKQLLDELKEKEIRSESCILYCVKNSLWKRQWISHKKIQNDNWKPDSAKCQIFCDYKCDIQDVSKRFERFLTGTYFYRSNLFERPYIYIYIYRVYQEKCARLRESVPYVKVYRYNPKHLYPNRTFTEIMAREKCGLLAVPRTAPFQLTRYVYTKMRSQQS